MPLYASICDVGLTAEAVRWEHMYTLMERLREQALALAVPYVSPTTTADNPFYYNDVIPYTLYQTFELDHGVVTKAYLSKSASVLTPWDFGPTPLHNLEANDELMFLADADGCWCKTLWQIKKVHNRPTLQAVGELTSGCCQTIDVPAQGDTLGYDQVFLPMGAAQRVERDADHTSGWRAAAKCRATDGGLYFLKEAGQVIAAQRQVTGQLTWQIRPRHFQMLLDQIMVVVNGSCGSKSDMFPWLCRASATGPPTLAEMIERLETGDGGFGPLFERFLPGCLQRTGCAVQLPWEGLTCGGQNCDGTAAPRLYCTTMQYFNGIISRLDYWLCALPCLQWADFASDIVAHPDATAIFTPGQPATWSVQFEPESDCAGSSADDYVHAALSLTVANTAPRCKNGRLRITVTGNGSAYTAVTVQTDALVMSGTTTTPCSVSALAVDGGTNPLEVAVQSGTVVEVQVYDNLGGATAPEDYRRGAVAVSITFELLL